MLVSKNRQKLLLTAAEQREMEPEEIREGYLVKKVRGETLLVDRRSHPCF